MAHKFDISKLKRLDSDERRRLLTPHETLAKLGYKKGDIMADIGSGSGLFTLAAAEICSENKIYAIDISAEMLSEVERRANEAGLHNIEQVKSDEYDFKLSDEAVDFVLICAVLHEVDDKIRFIREAARICRPDGTVAIIEYNETPTVVGPPLSIRLGKIQLKNLLADAGFVNISETDISDSFYAVAIKKQNK